MDLAVSIRLVHKVLSDHHADDYRDGLIGHPKCGDR
jgi:hypothetical protein